MPVYAPVAPYADRSRHPRALLLIVATHAVALAAVMTAKMEISRDFIPTITQVKLEPLPPEPQPNPPPQPKQAESTIDQPITVIPIPQPNQTVLDLTPVPLPDPGPVITKPDVVPILTEPVRVGPRFVTPESELKPPYPQQKLRMGEEAVLRLKLSIDERGRVTAVEPVGKADAVFLAAARRHLIVHWRYRPATEDGRAVASSTVITLRFELNE